jgi:hypothetical protein
VKFRQRAVRELIEGAVPAQDDSLTTGTRLIEFMSTRNLFGTLGVTDVWLASDGRGRRLEINIQGLGVYQSVILFPDMAPWLREAPAGEEMDLRAAAEHIYLIAERVVESVVRDLGQYLGEALPSYRVVVERPGLTETLPAGPGPRDALVTALGALSMAAVELGLSFAPGEARHELEEHGRYAVGSLSVTISYCVNWSPSPKLKWRPVVPAADRFVGLPHPRD